MKKIFAIAASTVLALGLTTAASAADFTGLRVGAVVGLDNVKNDEGLVYGVQAGFDDEVAKNVIVGATVELDVSGGKFAGLKNTDRDLSLAARVGYKLASPLLVYASGGYTNQRVAGVNFDGLRVGGGVELALTEKVYVGGEYRHSNYTNGVTSNKGLASLGYRF